MGTAGTALTLGPDTLGAETAAAYRSVLGGAGLVAAAVAVSQQPWRYRLAPVWMVVGCAGHAVNQLAFFEGVERTGVAVGSLVTTAAVPLAAGGLDWLGGRRPPAVWTVGVAIAVVGVGFLTGSDGSVAWLGLGFAAGAGLSGAVVALAAQRLMRDRPPLPAMATVVGGGALLLAPMAVLRADVGFGSAGAAATVIYLGLFTMAMPYALLGVGLHRLSLAGVAAVVLLEPAVAATLATTVLDEPVTGPLVAGIGLVLTGVAIASRRPTTASDGRIEPPTAAVAGGGGAAIPAAAPADH